MVRIWTLLIFGSQHVTVLYMISLSRVFVSVTYTTMTVDWCYLWVRCILNLSVLSSEFELRSTDLKNKRKGRVQGESKNSAKNILETSEFWKNYSKCYWNLWKSEEIKVRILRQWTFFFIKKEMWKNRIKKPQNSNQTQIWPTQKLLS